VSIKVVAPPKAWVCCRSLSGIVGSNPAGGMYVSCVMGVVRQKSLQWADQSSRSMLLSPSSFYNFTLRNIFPVLIYEAYCCFLFVLQFQI
jgi:hypothetical protein